MNTNTSKNFLFRILCGFFLGLSIVAPGVSGSVIAIFMGIYNKLIDIVSNPFKNLKSNFLYLFPMGIGAIISAILYIIAFQWLFDNYAVPSFSLFLGLIAGSLPSVLEEAKKEGFKKHFLIGTEFALIFAVALGLLGINEISFVYDSSNIIYLSICGLIAGIAAIMPGMSVSMILLLFGIYNFLLDSARALDFSVIISVGISFVIGMILFSRFVKYIFNRFYGFGYFMVFGFMIGSVICIALRIVLLEGLPTNLTDWILSLLMLGIGVCISISFQVLGQKFNMEDSSEDNIEIPETN